MYSALKGALVERGITNADLAARMTELGEPITAQTVGKKISEKSEFTLAEARAILDILGGEFGLDDFFRKKK